MRANRQGYFEFAEAKQRPILFDCGSRLQQLFEKRLVFCRVSREKGIRRRGLGRFGEPCSIARRVVLHIHLGASARPIAAAQWLLESLVKPPGLNHVFKGFEWAQWILSTPVMPELIKR